MTKKMLLSLLIGASVIVTAACSDTDENTSDETATDEQATEEQAAEDNEETMEIPEPDLEGVPDVVAEVNGEEISKEDFEAAYNAQFQQMSMQAMMAGQEVDQTQLKESVAESLVGQKLLVQETENRDIEASEEEINETLTSLAEQNGIPTSEEFLAALEEQGLSEEEVREQVTAQVKVDKLIAEESGDSEVTEEELQEYYDQMQAQQEEQEGSEELPPFEDIKSEIQVQIEQQKDNEVVQGLVTELREASDVTIHI